MSWTYDKLWLLLSGSCNNSSSQHKVVTIKYGGLSRGNRGKRFVQIHMQATVTCAGNRTPVGLFPVTDLDDNIRMIQAVSGSIRFQSVSCISCFSRARRLSHTITRFCSGKVSLTNSVLFSQIPSPLRCPMV